MSDGHNGYTMKQNLHYLKQRGLTFGHCLEVFYTALSPYLTVARQIYERTGHVEIGPCAVVSAPAHPEAMDTITGRYVSAWVFVRDDQVKSLQPTHEQVSDWRDQVAADETELGLNDWVAAQIKAGAYPEARQSMADKPPAATPITTPRAQILLEAALDWWKLLEPFYPEQPIHGPDLLVWFTESFVPSAREVLGLPPLKTRPPALNPGIAPLDPLALELIKQGQDVPKSRKKKQALPVVQPTKATKTLRRSSKPKTASVNTSRSN